MTGPRSWMSTPSRPSCSTISRTRSSPYRSSGLADYYTGSNSSYNVKKLVEGGFLRYSKSRIDRRTVKISLGERGGEIHALVSEAYRKHAATVEHLGGIQGDGFVALNRSLARLDRFWNDQIEYRL